eukprot:scaffold108755_cov21-Tisochrysis_lutea.AAC.1
MAAMLTAPLPSVSSARLRRYAKEAVALRRKGHEEHDLYAHCNPASCELSRANKACEGRCLLHLLH